MRSANRRQIFVLFATMLMVTVGFGIVIPIIPFVITDLGGSGRDLGLMVATWAAAQFLFSPMWGDLSDRIGRKPVILIGIAGTVVTQAMYGLSTQLWMFFVARFLAGAIGSAAWPTAMAYMADSSSEQERGGAMGLVSAAMYGGMMVGPGMAGWLATYSLSLPFFVAAALTAVVLVFAVLVLPESLPAAQRSAKPGRSRRPLVSEMVSALRGPMGQLFLLSFMLTFGMSHFWSVFSMYAMRRFTYTPGQVGTVMMVMGLGSAIMQSIVVGRLARRWGEPSVARAALLYSAFGYAAMLAARQFSSVILVTALFVMGSSLIMPMISSMISKRAGQSQGTALGLNNSFMSLGQVIGPIWAGSALDINIGLPFASGGVIMLAGFIMTLLLWRGASFRPQPVT